MNVTNYGDTDIFPYPVENLIFRDKPGDVKNVLRWIDANFDAALIEYPPEAVGSLTAAGYFGFRLGTQIDAAWNAYLLAAVIGVAPELESRRVPPEKQTVFSYRYSPELSAGSLFNRSLGWRQFQERSVELARIHAFVLECDIAEFYPRVYHHRLENALKQATQNTEAVRRIVEVLSRYDLLPIRRRLQNIRTQ